MGFPKIEIIAFASFFLILSTIEAIVTKPENSLFGPYVGKINVNFLFYSMFI